ncbi:nascent polypeptide-associated complex protein [Candidatus Woesearchaeota archaeon]|nr:nascent polypeptide-associated complex protein [Candidatus Woesearchaeota archaeon]
MIPGVNPRQMKQMMKRMGVSQVDIEATEVIIKTADGALVFTNPQVAKVNMMGQESYQITGTPVEQSLDTKPEINDDDIKTVMDQANVDEEKAKEAIENANGDLAEAILSLQND